MTDFNQNQNGSWQRIPTPANFGAASQPQAAPDAAARAQVASMLQTAVKHHEAERFDEAETLYRQILAIDPNHADAMHLLGLIAARSNLAYLGEVATRTLFLAVILYIFLQLWRVTYSETGSATLGTRSRISNTRPALAAALCVAWTMRLMDSNRV